MGAPLADPTRLGNWLGLGEFEPDSVELKRAEEVVATISDLVRGEARQYEWTMWDAPPNISAIVLMVAVECWVNPDNKTSVTMDDVTRRWESGELFSKSQLATIRAFRPNQSSGLGTVQFSRGLDSPSIALPEDGRRAVQPPSASAVYGRVVGGSSAVLYDGRGY